MREDLRDDVVRALLAELGRREAAHRLAHLVALRDVSRCLGALDDVVDESVDPFAASLAEQLDLVMRQVFARKDRPAWPCYGRGRNGNE